ncbi:MAG: hypothetical protein N2C14_07675 [Planctomycetales bacterium]
MSIRARNRWGLASLVSAATLAAATLTIPTTSSAAEATESTVSPNVQRALYYVTEYRSRTLTAYRARISYLRDFMRLGKTSTITPGAKPRVVFERGQQYVVFPDLETRRKYLNELLPKEFSRAEFMFKAMNEEKVLIPTLNPKALAPGQIGSVREPVLVAHILGPTKWVGVCEKSEILFRDFDTSRLKPESRVSLKRGVIEITKAAQGSGAAAKIYLARLLATKDQLEQLAPEADLWQLQLAAEQSNPSRPSARATQQVSPARDALKKAKLTLDKPDLAIKKLSLVILQYPDTMEALEAQELLEIFQAPEPLVPFTGIGHHFLPKEKYGSRYTPNK